MTDARAQSGDEAARTLAAIVESSDDAIIAKDLNGTILSWNGGAERIYGYSAAETIGRPIYLIVPPPLVNELSRILERIKAGDRVRNLEETLNENGHLVSEAGDGKSALRALTAGLLPFDVVLLDYHLPDSHDLALLSSIRQMAPNTAVIMMTAFSTPEMVEAARHIGAYRVVAKPFEVRDMANLVVEAHTSKR